MNNTNRNIIRNSNIYDERYTIDEYKINIVIVFFLLVYKIEPCNEVRQQLCCDIKNTTVKDMDFE